VSAETLGEHHPSVPFAFLYEYRPAEHQARLVSVSVETHDDLNPKVVDCKSESVWRFQVALSEDCLVVELGERASTVPIPGWPMPVQQATVLPIRVREHSEPAAFMVLGIHPGRAFDDTYRMSARVKMDHIAPR
jgi:hypothetical protein